MKRRKNESKYKDHVEEFVKEKIQRPELTMKSFCKQKTICYDYFLRYFKANPKCAEAILNGQRQRYHWRSVDVDDALYKKALAGDPRAMDLWYAKMENWNRQQPQPVTTIQIVLGPGMLSEDEKQVVEVRGTVKRDEPLEIEGQEIPLLENGASQVTRDGSEVGKGNKVLS
jgi:hypothetical protein